jgi:pyrroline-5-carboxylate reductase
MQTGSKKVNIGIFGFGNMGQAIFSVITKNKKIPDKKIYICSTNAQKVGGAICVDNIEELFIACDMIFFCIKPQDFYKLVINKKISKKSPAIIISIMAGVTIKNIKKITQTKKIVRTMPNLALQVKESVTGCYASRSSLTKRELEQVSKILDSFGLTIFTKNEGMLNAITAISGSGPAYVFLFINALTRSAISLGFAEKEARQIVFQTMRGSLSYACHKNTPLDDLIKKVTSKKGTTEAALNKINPANFYKKWQQATLKAYEKAQELSNYDIK